MDIKDVKKAMLRKSNVELRGITYSYIEECILKVDRVSGKFYYLLSLMDKCGHSVVVDKIENCKLIKGDDEVEL